MCAAMLFPLVESSLPEEILRTWQRQNNNAAEAKERLEALMKFLGNEVQNEERISMVKSGFETTRESTTTVGKVNKKVINSTSSSHGVATAAALHTADEEKDNVCIFCLEQHENANCNRAKQLPLEKRQEIVKEKKACFLCLKTNHSFKKCRSKVKCAWCERKHALLLCRELGKKDSKDNQPTETSAVENLTTSCNNISDNIEVFLQTLRVKLIGPRGEKIVRVLIDSGSQKSYVLKDAAENMQLTSVGQTTMIHLLFGGEKTEPRRHKQYHLRLASLDGTYRCDIKAFDEPRICHKIPATPVGPWIQDLDKIGVRLTDTKERDEPIELLLGADVVGRLYTGKIHQLAEGPTALQTKLGWTLMGRSNNKKASHENTVLNVFSMFSRETQISDLWNLDVLGIADPVATVSKEMHLEKVKQHFEQTIKTDVDGRFVVNLPWKENHPPLSGNKQAAEKRLRTLTSKLNKEGLYKDYQQVFEEWLRQGIIEKVESLETTDNEYFLPHRHVVKLNSTTRIRPVFDASASGKNSPSLNQCLETGPNLIELIPSILLRFRQDKVGLSADITKAFLQIRIDQADRDALKFLWWDQQDTKRMIIYRHQRVVFGINSSPFLLGATIDHHLESELNSCESQSDHEVIKKLKQSFYVDNCVTSVATQEDAARFKEIATATMSKAKFELRGWEFNGHSQEPSVTSILGISWDKSADQLSLSVNFLEALDEPITKRKILAIAHKIFDPLGWVCPVLLQPKLLLQRLWSINVGWDAEMPTDIVKEFKKWYNQLPVLQTLWIPRWIFGNGEEEIGLHMFVDASKHAYAAALFVRVREAHQVTVHLVQAKSRVGPAQEISIPRMELLAATVGARLMNSVMKALNFSQVSVTFWTDSSTVLSWLRRGLQ